MSPGRATHDAPRPEVLYLRTIFKKISDGAYRVPAFQRGFVWEEAQVLAILESVYRGFPLGSVLLWNVHDAVLRANHSAELPLPQLAMRYPVAFVLDGLQRMTSLFGCFHQQEYPDSRFAAVFDLETERFSISEQTALAPNVLRLSHLFDTKQLLERQRLMLDRENADHLVQKSMDLQQAFQDYMVPVVTIADRTVEEVVEIFERVNSTGTPLSKVDFMRAVTWSEEFDLGPQIESMQTHFEESGFDLSEETIVKLLGLGAGLEPTTESLMQLRDLSPSRLNIARDRVMSAAGATVEFLWSENIYSYDYVPYEGQFIVLTSAFLEEPAPPPRLAAQMRRWFYSTSFSESLRGKPDHVVARESNVFRAAARGETEIQPRRVSLAAEELVSRRFTARRALSAGFAALFGSRQPRDLVSGLVIEPSAYMSEFTNSSYAPIASASAVTEAAGRKLNSRRTIPNMVVATDASQFPRTGSAASLLRAAPTEALRSQFISDDAMRLLVLGDEAGFLHLRSVELADAVEPFLSGYLGR